MDRADYQEINALFRDIEADAKEKYGAEGFHIIHDLKRQVSDLKKKAERLSAENADLRARLEQAERERDEAREEMKEAAGELLIPLPQSDPTVRKLLLANSIMRQERDAARAGAALLAEVTSLREFVDSVAELIGHEGPRETEAILDRIHVHHKDYLRGWGTLEQVCFLLCDNSFNFDRDDAHNVATEKVVALMAELARLREIERLAKKFKEQALPLENRNYHPRWYVAAEPLFAALDKETAPNG